MKKFEHVLITGASSGIGEALALHCAKNNVKMLSICGRNVERLERVADLCKKEGAIVEAKIVDVTDKNAVEKWVNEAEEKMPINAVFANAGVATLVETADNVRRTFAINVGGVVNTVLPVVDLFRKGAERKAKQIVIMASIAGYHGMPTCPSYAASKACVKSCGEGLRLALAKEGIGVSVVCPGFVRSRITDKNTCPMPFFWEADKAARVICERVEKNVGLIAFPWPMRFATWLVSILPNRLSDFVYSKLPYKV